MNQYSFIHHGARVHWNDPAAADFGEEAKDHLARTYVVYSINGDTKGKVTDDDDIVLIYEKGSGTEAEVYPHELVELKESRKERVSRYTRSADVFLLSCLKYADKRTKAAEKKAREAEQKLQSVLNLSKKERAELRKEQYIQGLVETATSLERKTAELRNQLNYYMAAYHTLKKPEPVSIDNLEDGFQNTPENIARFLLSVPSEEPMADDPEVRVVCENDEGEIFPVTYAWYDKQRAMVRLSSSRREPRVSSIS